MFELFPILKSGYASHLSWAVPLTGGLVCTLAYLVGRRFLATKPTLAPINESEAVHRSIPRDRRLALRRKGNAVEVQISLCDGQPVLRGWVLDRSIGGLCIRAEQQFSEHTLLRIRPRSGAETMPWVEVTVRSCRRDGANFELGCQFHRLPTWNVLLQFG